MANCTWSGGRLERNWPSWRFGGIAIRKNVHLFVSLTEHTAQHLICKFQHHRRGGIYDRNY